MKAKDRHKKLLVKLWRALTSPTNVVRVFRDKTFGLEVLPMSVLTTLIVSIGHVECVHETNITSR